MIRFIFRFFGLLLLALGFIFFVYDGTKSIADQTWPPNFSTVESIWENIHQSSLTTVQAAVERLSGSWLWAGVMQPYFLQQWAWLALVVIGAILILVGRKKRPLIGYARD
jgi:hypothetical protein